MDKDADRLLCHRPEYSTAGGSGYYIQYKRRNETVGKDEPAGVVCTPFSAESRAAIHPFEHVLLSPGFRLQYRWIVDCQSICTALSTLGEKDTALLYHLRRLITDLTTRHENNLDIVWVSSHCGLEGNEEADKLAKSALRRTLQDQLAVPVEFSDAKAFIRARKKKTVEDVEKLPQETLKHWTLRKARVILNQLYTGFCAPFQPMRRVLGLGQDKCRRCNTEETVPHFFTCKARATRRRAHFNERIDWRRKILQKPLEILGYLLGEEEPHIKELFGLGEIKPIPSQKMADLYVPITLGQIDTTPNYRFECHLYYFSERICNMLTLDYRGKCYRLLPSPTICKMTASFQIL